MVTSYKFKRNPAYHFHNKESNKEDSNDNDVSDITERHKSSTIYSVFM